MSVIGGMKHFQDKDVVEYWHNDGDQVLAFGRGNLVFVFNFNPTRSFQDYGFLVPSGSYRIVLDSDSTDFGGFGRIDDSQEHFTVFDQL